jgi:hypothetical protein
MSARHRDAVMTVPHEVQPSDAVDVDWSHQLPS